MAYLVIVLLMVLTVTAHVLESRHGRDANFRAYSGVMNRDVVIVLETVVVDLIESPLPLSMTSSRRWNTIANTSSMTQKKKDQLTVSITNVYPSATELAIVLTGPSPVAGASSNIILEEGGATSWVFEATDGSWVGNLAVGLPGVPYPAAQNSLIEASLVVNATPPIYYDVSFVNSFSVPITCSAGRTTLGCLDPGDWLANCPESQQLFVNGTLASCINLEGPYTGPSPPFNDGSCSGTAYTWTLDNQAQSGSFDSTIRCCVGPSCPTPNINIKRETRRGLTRVKTRHGHGHAHTTKGRDKYQ